MKEERGSRVKKEREGENEDRLREREGEKEGRLRGERGQIEGEK